MRILIGSAAAVLLTACASQEQQPSTPATPAAVAQSAAVAETTRNPYPGYKQKEKSGRTVYCKKVSRVGTNFVDEYCMTADELDRLEDRAREDREQFRRNQTVCGAGICGDDG